MHRKDYIKLCHAIAKGVVTSDFMGNLVAMLKEDNPRFDEDKFKEYLKKLVAVYTSEDKEAEVTSNIEPPAEATQ